MFTIRKKKSSAKTKNTELFHQEETLAKVIDKEEITEFRLSEEQKEQKLVIPLTCSTVNNDHPSVSDQVEDFNVPSKMIQYGLQVSELNTNVVPKRRATQLKKRDLKAHLNDLPDEVHIDYSSFSIDEYGFGVLRGMGLKEEPEVSQEESRMNRRPERLGLGAVIPDMTNPVKKRKI